jgi:tripartite-type tricarboxylate transporter receptor subunit TctC
MKRIAVPLLLLGIALTAAGAMAQPGFPNRPIRIVVPLAAGGNLDIVARAVAQGLGERLGQPVLVENRPGASSLVGTQLVARSPADGYTLLAIANTFTSVPAIVSAPGYDPIKDFVGVSLTCRIPMVLVVNPSSPARTVRELIDLARAKEGAQSYGSSGNGSTGHIAAEMFSRQARLKMLHVPYKGNAPALTDLMGGQISMLFDQISTSAPHIRSGKVRALGVSTLTRAATLPDVPTIDESGLPGFEDVTFNGLLAPAGTPSAIIERLHAEIATVLVIPELKKRHGDQGIELIASSSAQSFTEYLHAQTKKYATLAREAGIKAD